MSFSWYNLGTSVLETLGMVLISTLIAYIIGLPVGVLLHVTSPKGLKPNRWINLILGLIVNVMRSIPCLLIIIIFIPFTNFVFGRGSWSGHWYSMIVPLVFASFAFISRLVETSLQEVESGKIEAAKSLGASDFQIIYRVLLPEARTSLLGGLAVATVSIIGYTSFSGYIAAGGVISYAFNLGYYGTNELAMWLCVLFIVVIVQIIQELTLYFSRKLDRRKKIV